MTVVGDDDQSIYSSAARRSATSSSSGTGTGRAIVVLRRNYRSLGADPRRRLPPRPVQRSGPARGEGRDLEEADPRARAARDAAPVRHHAFQRPARRRTGSPAEIRRRVETGAAPRPPRSSSGRTSTPTRSSDRSTSRRSRGGSPARPASTPGPRSAAAPSCAPSRTRRRASTSRAGRVGAVRNPRRDLAKLSGSARRRNRRVRGPRGARDPARPAAPLRHPGARARRLVADLRRYRDLAQRRPAGEVLYAFLRGSGWLKPARGRERRSRGGALEHRPVLRHRPDPVGAARRRSGRVPGPPPADADRGGRRPGDRGPRPRRRCGRRDDRPQGEGPRVPGRLPAGPGHGPVPGDRPPRAAGAAGGAGRRDRCPRATTSPGGAPAVLRRR